MCKAIQWIPLCSSAAIGVGLILMAHSFALVLVQ
jgi:hypothetical protein